MPQTQNMSGLNLALHWHLGIWHIQGKSQSGVVFFGDVLLKEPAFMSM